MGDPTNSSDSLLIDLNSTKIIPFEAMSPRSFFCTFFDNSDLLDTAIADFSAIKRLQAPQDYLYRYEIIGNKIPVCTMRAQINDPYDRNYQIDLTRRLYMFPYSPIGKDYTDLLATALVEHHGTVMHLFRLSLVNPKTDYPITLDFDNSSNTFHFTLYDYLSQTVITYGKPVRPPYSTSPYGAYFPRNMQMTDRHYTYLYCPYTKNPSKIIDFIQSANSVAGIPYEINSSITQLVNDPVAIARVMLELAEMIHM